MMQFYIIKTETWDPDYRKQFERFIFVDIGYKPIKVNMDKATRFVKLHDIQEHIKNHNPNNEDWRPHLLTMESTEIIKGKR